MSLLKSMMLSSDERVQHRRRYPTSCGKIFGFKAKAIVTSVLGAMAIATTTALPTIAADPFRTSDPSAIDDQTELAFYAMFRDGDYQEARTYLANANPDEPLAHAMNAAWSYLDGNLENLKVHAEQTLNAAAKLETSDPLRSHLYKAVGHFMDGAYIYRTESTITAIPKTLGKLNEVLSNMRAAEAISPTDPELNLLKGFMDLQLAVALPRSNPEEVIAQLQAHAKPEYLVDRGIAIAYRDLEKYDQALEYINTAIRSTDAVNPDLLYLKGQILRNQANDLEGEAKAETLQSSVRHFRRAFDLRAQMPRELAQDLGFEFCRAKEALQGRDRGRQACRDWVDNQLATPVDPI